MRRDLPLLLQAIRSVQLKSKIQNQLAKLLMRWRTETGDSVPERISVDEFGRESGERVVKGDVFRGETPGESNEAWNIDRSGPR